MNIPTESAANRLGTGEVDFTASLDLIKDIGPTSICVSSRRRFEGRPIGSTTRSVWDEGSSASIGSSRELKIGAD